MTLIHVLLCLQTPQDYQDSYLRQLIQQGSKVSPLHSFAYDAVWVAARALSQVMEAMKHREKYSSQRNTSVSEEEVHKKLLEAVKQTQFEGVTVSTFTQLKHTPVYTHLKHTPVYAHL